MGLYKNMGLYAGMGLYADTNIVNVLLKSTKEVRITLLKATVQTKTTDDCVEMYKKNKKTYTRTTYIIHVRGTTKESIIYGLVVQFRPMGLYDEAL